MVPKRFCLITKSLTTCRACSACKKSADRGCTFCFALRDEISRQRFDYHGYISIRLAYHWGDYAFPYLGLAALVVELEWRNDIPSIPPTSDSPDNIRDCIIFTLETDDSEFFNNTAMFCMFPSAILILISRTQSPSLGGYRSPDFEEKMYCAKKTSSL